MLQLLKNTTGIHSFLQFSQQQNPTRNNCIVIVYKVARLVILSRKMFLLVWWGGGGVGKGQSCRARGATGNRFETRREGAQDVRAAGPLFSDQQRRRRQVGANLRLVNEDKQTCK